MDPTSLFNDLPVTQPTVAFHDLPDAAHGVSFADLPDLGAPEVSPETQQSVRDFLDNRHAMQTGELSLWQLANTAPTQISDAIDAATPSGKTTRNFLDLSGVARIAGALVGTDKVDQFLGGETHAVAALAKQIATPFGVATLGLGAAPKAVQKVAAFIFAMHMAKHAPESVASVVNAKTPQELGSALANTVISVGGATLAAKHALGAESAPLTTAAQDATRGHEESIPNHSGPIETGAAPRRNADQPSGQTRLREGLPASGSDASGSAQALNGQPGQLAGGKPETLAPQTTAAIEAAQPGKVTQLLERRQKTTDPVERQRLWDEAQDELRKDLPQGPGKMTVGELPPQETTGLKKAVVKDERLARGLEDLPPAERQHEETVVQKAEDAVAANQTLAPNLITRILNGDQAISEHDAAILLVERNRVMNLRRQWEATLGDKDSTPEVRIEAKTALEGIEQQLARLDQAQRAAGRTWGRLGHMYQRLIREDYTLEGMESKARAAKGIPLTKAERGKIAEQAKKIERLQKEADAKEEAITDAIHARNVSETLQKTLDELRGEKPKYGQEVFDIARGIVNRWKAEASESQKALRQAMGQTNVGLDPTLVLHAAKIIRAKIGELGLDFAETSTQMIAEFGENIKPLLSAAWKKAQALIEKEKAGRKVKEVVKNGVSTKTEKTPVDIRAKAKAEATAGEPLSHQTVYELARAHINAGVHGEDAVMAAVHRDLKEVYPDVTERDSRRAFSEYGEVKFPSKEADKVELRELRTLVRLQESIDRETAGLDSLHTGLQRPKATQAIREKQKTLNELLKKRQGPPSPETLASRNEARVTALKNQIEDLDKQLRTGQKPTKGESLADSPEVERLKAERDAMKVKLAEIEAEANPPPTAAEQYNKVRAAAIKKRLAELRAKISAGDYTRTPKRIPPELNAENQKTKVQLQEAKDEFDRGVKRAEEAQRPWWKKVLEQVSGAARFSALSGYHTLGKLAAFDMARAIETPLVEATGSVAKHIPGLRGIFRASTMESPSFIRDMRKFYTGMAIKGIKQAGRVLRRGDSENSLLYGKKQFLLPKWYDFFGRLHQAEKTPLVTGATEMYVERGYDAAIRAGLDVNDPFVKAEINRAAYEHAQSAILQENNKFAEAVNMLHTRLEAVNPKSGQVEITNQVISTLVKTLLTKGIVRTPSNYIAQTIARTPIGLATGLSKAAVAKYRGTINLKPVEANATAKLIKVGAVGSAFFILGAIDATKKEEDRIFGGYYQPGRKRDGEDVDWGKLRIAGHQLPHVVTHNPLTESAQMGSTMMRVAMSTRKKSDPEQRGIMEGMVKAIVGLATKAPIASPAMRMGNDRSNVGADILKGLVPQLLQNIAEDTDSEERAPKSFREQIESAIPILRNRVPVKEQN